MKSRERTHPGLTVTRSGTAQITVQCPYCELPLHVRHIPALPQADGTIAYSVAPARTALRLHVSTGCDEAP